MTRFAALSRSVCGRNSRHQLSTSPRLLCLNRQCTTAPAVDRKDAANPVANPAAPQHAGPEGSAAPKQQRHVDFTDGKSVYQNKSFRQLLRAYFVFGLCSIDKVVDNQTKILSWTRKLLGAPLFRILMKTTVYPQFLGGETPQEVQGVARQNARAGLYSMFAYTASESHGLASGSDADSDGDIYSKNHEAIKASVVLGASCKEFSPATPQVSTKLTFLSPVEPLRSFTSVIRAQSDLVTDLLMDSDSAKRGEFLSLIQQCAKDMKMAPEVTDNGLPVPDIQNIQPDNVSSLLTNTAFHMTLNQRPSDLQAFNKKGPEIQQLNEREKSQLLTLWGRMFELSKMAAHTGVTLIWDAEQSYLQLAIDNLSLDTLRLSNRDRAVVLQTYQCYLKRTHDVIRRDLSVATREDFCLGAKVVRGAYMTEETNLAEAHGYPDPVNPSYDATTHMYESVANELLDFMKSDRNKANKCHTTFATHNEDTVNYVLGKMAEKGMTFDNFSLSFAQLLGMRDHISFTLGQAGIPVAKLIHYGLVLDGVAYLSRRLLENRSGLPTGNLERKLLGAEVLRRMLRRQ